MKTLFSRLFLISRRSRLSGASLFVTVVCLTLGWPHAAAAQVAETMGEVMCNAWNNVGPYASLLDAFAYTIGGTLIGMGLLHFRNHTDSPHNHPVYQGILKIAGGAALITLPYFISAIYSSMFSPVAIVASTGGLMTCSAAASSVNGYVVPAPGLPDLVTMLTNMVDNMEYPVIALIEVTSTIMGFIFILMGVVKASKHGTDPRGASVPHILIYLIIGGLLICSGESFSAMIGSLFGIGTTINTDIPTNAGTVLGWNAVIALGSNPMFATAIAAGLTFIQVVGCLAFIRGLYIIKKAVEGGGQATLAQGFTHLIGGAIALNIYQFLEGMDATFGTNLL